MAQPRIGGSFAPPLSDELLARYRGLIEGLHPQSQIRDVMDKLHRCAAAWWELPESSGDGTRPHPSGRGLIVPLDASIASALWELVPWDDELASRPEPHLRNLTARSPRRAATATCRSCVRRGINCSPSFAGK